MAFSTPDLERLLNPRAIAVIGASSNLSRIGDHACDIAEIDINPLFVRETGHGVIAADALIVLQAKRAADRTTNRTINITQA